MLTEVNVRLKKLNAICALLTFLALLAHVGYNGFAYLTMYYNPTLKTLFTVPFLLCVCVHAVLGMCSVFLLGDGTRLDLYARPNRRTVVQRVTAALIFPLLIVHLKTYSLLEEASKGGAWFAFALILLLQIVFYAVIAVHTVTSVTRALITLGALASREVQRQIDRAVAILCTAVFLAATYAVVSGELSMFLPQ